MAYGIIAEFQPTYIIYCHSFKDLPQILFTKSSSLVVALIKAEHFFLLFFHFAPTDVIFIHKIFMPCVCVRLYSHTFRASQKGKLRACVIKNQLNVVIRNQVSCQCVGEFTLKRAMRAFIHGDSFLWMKVSNKGEVFAP